MIVTNSFQIKGRDYEGAGAASSSLKETLKKLGVNPGDIRRAVISAYEAEMNVVVHARSGDMRFVLDADRLTVEISDEGPGIQDIEQAMIEGYSTAPSEARELGFGAGMGLPNIKNNSDKLDIRSTVGSGTRIRFIINLRCMAVAKAATSPLVIDRKSCKFCMQCVSTCPSKAIRIMKNGPQILSHLCIGCTSCIGVCSEKVFSPFPQPKFFSPPEPETVLVISSAFPAHFGAPNSSAFVRACMSLGFREVIFTRAWEKALCQAVLQHVDARPDIRPIFSPVCPAVVALIETRFPSLMEHLAPFVSPIEAVKSEIGNRPAVFVADCPSQYSALSGETGNSEKHRIITPSQLERIFPEPFRRADNPDIPSVSANRTAASFGEAILRTSGLDSVIRVLEQAENGLLWDIPAIELYACVDGCYGSSLYSGSSCVAEYRWKNSGNITEGAGRAVERDMPFSARQGMRLDEDLSRAINRLSEIEAISRMLPGRDCCACGAPSCESMAVDIVMGRSTIDSCAFLRKKGESRR